MDTWGNLSNLWIPCKESQLNINEIHSTCLAQAQLYVTPKIGYVNAMLLFRSWHLAINSPLGHFNGDQLTPSPQFTRHTKTTVTPKFNSSNCNMAFVKLQRTQSLARPTTHVAITTFSTSHNSISSHYSQPFHESCSTKSKPNIPCCK